MPRTLLIREQNGASSVLQSRVNQLETANDEIEKQLVQLKEILKAATETRDAQVQKYGQVVEKLRFITSELEAKDAQVQLLTASNTLSFAADSLQPSNSKDQEHPKRNANRAEKRLPTVAEDSQPNDVPPSTVAKPGSTKGIEMSTPSRHHQDQLIGRSRMSSPLEGFDDMLDDLGDLAELCSPLPTSASQKQGSARTITTQYTDILVGKGSQEVSPPSRLTVSYDSRSTAHRSIHFSHPSDTPIFPGTSSVSQADRTDLSTHGSKYDKQKSPRQKASPKQSSRRRGILKESTAEKRPVSTAGLAPADPHRTSKRVKDLGPVIPDNQSPQGSRIPARNHRPAKMNSRKQPRGKINPKRNFVANCDSRRQVQPPFLSRATVKAINAVGQHRLNVISTRILQGTVMADHEWSMLKNWEEQHLSDGNLAPRFRHLPQYLAYILYLTLPISSQDSGCTSC